MCFAIPYKVIDLDGTTVYIENGKKIKLGKELKADVGDYIQVIGNVGVQVLSPKQGIKLRKMIKKLS